MIALSLLGTAAALPALAAAALPFAGARAVPFARSAAVVGALCAVAAAVAQAVAPSPPGLGGVLAPHLLPVDALSATLGPAISLGVGAAVVALPRRFAHPGTLAAMLLQQALGVGLLLTGSLPALVGGELLSTGVAIAAMPAGRARRTGARMLGVAAAGLLATGLGLAALMPLGSAPSLGAAAAAASGHPLMLGALGLVAALRLGLWPFHGWVTVAYEEMPTTAVVPLVLPASALMLLERVLTPALAIGGGHAPTWLVGLLLLGALMAYGQALVQTRLRRGLALLTAGGLSMLMVAVLDPAPEGVRGGVALWAAWMVSMAGFAVAVGAATSRLGVIDLRQHHALHDRAPRLGALFLLLGLASAAGPGTIDFVTEDILLHGSLVHHAWMGALLLAGVGLHAWTVMRWTFRVFYGPGPKITDPLLRMPLRPRERWALLTLLVLLIAGGLMPSALPVLAVGHG